MKILYLITCDEMMNLFRVFSLFPLFSASRRNVQFKKVLATIDLSRQTSWAIFSTPHFLCNLRMRLLSCRGTLHQAEKASQEQTQQLTEPILKLGKKLNVVNMTQYLKTEKYAILDYVPYFPHDTCVFHCKFKIFRHFHDFSFSFSFQGRKVLLKKSLKILSQVC